jgi:hypothetical protein
MFKFSSKAKKRLSICFGSCFLLSIPAQASQDISLLKRVREHWKEGDFSLAKKQIRAYLEKNPDPDLGEELHLLLGDLYLQEGNFASALEEYTHVTKESFLEKILYNKALCLYEEKKVVDLLDLVENIESKGTSLKKEQTDSIKYLLAKILYELPEKEEGSTKQAIALFESLLKSSFDQTALIYLTNLYLEINEKEKASCCYLSLAKKNPPEKADLLFEAAILIADTQKEKAIHLFQDILQLDSPKKGPAAYNALLLKYQMGAFKEAVLFHEANASIFSQEQTPKIALLLGKSLYTLQNYKEALEELVKGVEDESLSLEDRQNLYFTMLECAYKTQNIYLYKEIWQKTCDSPYPNQNEELAHFAYLDLLKLYDRKQDLINESHAFLLKYPAHENKEKVFFNLTSALYESGKWQETEEHITAFLGEFSESTSKHSLLRLQINCAAKMLEESSSEALAIHRSHWTQVLKTSLETPNLLTSEEKEKYLFELTKNVFLEGNFPLALELQEELVSSYPNTASRTDLQLIKVLCYLNDPESKVLFALHAEKLLESNPEIPEAFSLHLHLFNAYLQLGKESAFSHKDELLEKAAGHLYFVFQKKPQSLKKENMRWLFEHYYEQLETTPSSIAQALSIGEFLLSDGFSSQETKEYDLYRFCKLLSITGNFQKKAGLLDEWIGQKEFPIERTLQRHLIFELAETHKQLGNSKKAIDLYDALIHNSNDSSILAAEALLEKSKLLFSSLKKEEKTTENPVCLEILGHLKDLEIQRDLKREPLHLEAALEYISCKSSLIENEALKEQKTIELLHILQENFSYPTEGLIEQEKVVTNYLSFVEGEILRYEGKTEEAKKRFEEIMNNPLTTTALKQRTEDSYKELSKTL